VLRVRALSRVPDAPVILATEGLSLLSLLSPYMVVCLYLGCDGRVCVLMWVSRGVLCQLDNSSS
jgi:hypothetical protein